jgi:hypothetical protein
MWRDAIQREREFKPGLPGKCETLGESCVRNQAQGLQTQHRSVDWGGRPGATLTIAVRRLVFLAMRV